MKKLSAIILLLCFSATAALAQETEVKVKKTSSPTQKVHNMFSKHKKHNGVKIKRKRNGHKTKTTIKNGKVETKTSMLLWRREETAA